MVNIILADDSLPSENGNSQASKEKIVRPNLFQGNTEAKIGAAKFPEWDIVPPSQFINPRIKPQ